MKPILVFQTDFTYKEGAVCSMYGVVKSVDRELEIFDGTHEIQQYNTYVASYRLYQSMKYWPTGTIFVSVVDPGVGTSRKACVAKTSDGYYVVTPDNGSLTHLKKWVGIKEVREIDESINRLKGKGSEEVAIFHGRDLFGYCAARLASGIISYDQVGPSYEVNDIVEHDIFDPYVQDNKVFGYFEINDPNFGNLWTNIPRSLFFDNDMKYGDIINLKVYNDDDLVYDNNILFHQSFGFVDKGEPIIYNNELMKIAVALSMDSFCEKTNISFGPEYKVVFEKC
ncbi:MAG: SAM-dependent chlorinase/fluorinase [Erysipelotrichaceae bacterium]